MTAQNELGEMIITSQNVLGVEIIDSQNNLGEFIANAQNANGESIVKAQNALGNYIVDSQNAISEDIVDSQNALSQSIVDAANANGQATVNARNAMSTQHNDLGEWLHSSLCLIFEKLNGTCTEFIGPLSKDQVFVPMELRWPEDQPTIAERMMKIERALPIIDDLRNRGSVDVDNDFGNKIGIDDQNKNIDVVKGQEDAGTEGKISKGVMVEAAKKEVGMVKEEVAVVEEKIDMLASDMKQMKDNMKQMNDNIKQMKNLVSKLVGMMG